MADVKWIKLATNIFDNRKIRQIETLPNGDAVIVVWLKLLCLGGNINDSGMIYFTKEIPYTDHMLATQFNTPLSTIQLALKTFEQFGMIEVEDNILHIANWEKYQNVEGMERIREQTKKRVAKHREKKKQLQLNECNVTVTQCNGIEEDKDIDIDIDKEIDIDNMVDKQTRHKYGLYKNVSLTDGDLEKLKTEFPDWEQRIERLSEYIASTGKSYKNHLATIRAWARKDNQGRRVGKSGIAISNEKSDLDGVF